MSVFTPFPYWELARVALLRLAVTLVERKGGDDYRHDREVGHTPVVMHQQRRQQEIVDEEQGEEDGKLAPHQEYLCPVERNRRIADGAHIKTK
jgi:hypothetical protein